MTPYRIHTSSNPMAGFARVLPMSKEDAEFWKLRREKAERERK